MYCFHISKGHFYNNENLESPPNVAGVSNKEENTEGFFFFLKHQIMTKKTILLMKKIVKKFYKPLFNLNVTYVSTATFLKRD